MVCCSPASGVSKHHSVTVRASLSGVSSQSGGAFSGKRASSDMRLASRDICSSSAGRGASGFSSANSLITRARAFSGSMRSMRRHRVRACFPSPRRQHTSAMACKYASLQGYCRSHVRRKRSSSPHARIAPAACINRFSASAVAQKGARCRISPKAARRLPHRSSAMHSMAV